MERIEKDQYGDICEYDSNNNVIYYRDSNGYECWQEYDSNNNIIHLRTNNGYECWKEYDSNNSCTHFRNSDGDEYWYEYDNNNNLIEQHSTNPNITHQDSLWK